jgi:hypothetical protein
MTHGDIKSIRVQAYNAAFRAAKSDGIVTSEEESANSSIKCSD